MCVDTGKPICVCVCANKLNSVQTQLLIEFQSDNNDSHDTEEEFSDSNH